MPPMVRHEKGNNGLQRAVITTPAAEAHVYLHGAHVTHYQRREERPVLFLSGKSLLEAGKPIRGGVPVIFPWFGPKADDPKAPAHGVARLREWAVESEGEAEICLVLRVENPGSVLRYRVTVGERLEMALEVENNSAAAIRYEEALHTYFAVSDVRQVRVTGLAGAEYLDKLENFARKREQHEWIWFAGEFNRIYPSTRATCVISDPGWQRRIVVEKEGSDSTVVWNPAVTQTRTLPDLGMDEWPRFVCIETCNVGANAVTLPPGQRHVMQARIHPASES